MHVNSRTAKEGPLNRRDMSMEQMPDKIGQISPTSAETHEPSTIAAIAMNGASSAGTDNKYNLVMDSHIKYTNKSAGKGVNIRLVTPYPMVENDKSSPLVMTAIPTSVLASNGGKNQQNSLTDEIMSAATTASVIKQVPGATIANSAWLDGVAADESVYNGFDDIHLMEGVNVNNTNAYGGSMPNIDQPSGGNNTSSVGNYLSDESQKYMLADAQDFRNSDFAFGEMGTNGSAAISGGSGSRNISLTAGSVGKPTHKCHHCGKKYSWRSTLTRHKNFECGGREPSHQCPYCPYKSKQPGNLGVHVRRLHSNLPQLPSRRR